MTIILHCHWWEFWSCDTAVIIILSIIFIKNEKLLIQIMIGANLSYLGFSAGYRRFQIGCVFAEYNLFKPTIFKQNFIYIIFCKNLTQFKINFLETGTSDGTLRGLDQLLKCLSFSL